MAGQPQNRLYRSRRSALITMHGFASTWAATSPFGAITPCGIANVTMTSIEQETGVNHPLESIADRMAQLARKRINHLAVSSVVARDAVSS
jgi:lipoate-protein ligase B